jgi:hypothetical protein
MKTQPLTACKQYCLAAGATQGNIAYTQIVSCNSMKTLTIIITLLLFTLMQWNSISRSGRYLSEGKKVNDLTIVQADGKSSNCLNDLEQNPSSKITQDFIEIKNKLEQLDFFITNKSGQIERVKTTLSFNSDSTLAINDSVCSQFNNYNIFSLTVKKRKIYKNNFYPWFELKRFDFNDESAAGHFFDLVLAEAEKNDNWNKSPYVYLKSGKSCYKISTQAYLYYYDFMDSIVKQVDPKAKRIDHLL